ncbi:MAG: TIM barrel protein [Lachnospiraceae bacterium]|nr:TIM barrel protein [Lachnospiraceae bacterium]MBP5254945.1 TIM barrel protein [Lachnospiraceae bacterium]
MRLGISYFSGIKDAGRWASELHHAGAKAVVFPLTYQDSMDDIHAFQKAAQDYDLTIAEVTAWSNPMAVNRKDAEMAMEKTVEQLKLADYIGASCCLNISGANGAVWNQYYPMNFDPDFYRRTVETIQTIIDRAEPQRTSYAMQCMPWMVPTGPDEYLALKRDVNHPRFGVHLDIAGWMNSFDRLRFQRMFMDEVFAKLRGQIVSARVHDVGLQQAGMVCFEEKALGEGLLDVAYFMEKADNENAGLPVILDRQDSRRAFFKGLRELNRRYGTTHSLTVVEP